MSFKLTGLAAALVMAAPAIAFADDIQIIDAYARAASPMAKSGAAFMQIVNNGDTDDRLIEARSDVAARVELHTHKETGDGIMQMIEVEEGFAVPAGSQHDLARGGDHVMFMGLTAPFEDGGEISVTLVFEEAGEIELTIPVDLSRKPAGGHSGHMQQ